VVRRTALLSKNDASIESPIRLLSPGKSAKQDRLRHFSKNFTILEFHLWTRGSKPSQLASFSTLPPF
jgi:hypothetical protein